MERERVARTTRVLVPEPGVLRGFDEMHVLTTLGRRQLLVSADACVPYRTNLEVVERCDGRTIAQALERDLSQNGAPLVWRVDRARTHQTDKVGQVLRSHGVLLLHGPPRLARYYGQLERQNREHRAWLGSLGVMTPPELTEACERMRVALNTQWKRSTLGWRTAAEVWSERRPIVVDRDELRAEVEDRTERLRRSLADALHTIDPERLAIEQALRKRGFLAFRIGGWC